MTEPAVSEVCIDASIAAKLVLNEDRSDLASSLWRGWEDADVDVIAPALITWEVANAIRVAASRGRIDRSSVAELYHAFRELPITLIPHYEMPQVAWEQFVLGRGLTVSPYDATYLATAVVTSCDLWTADDRLVRTVGDDLPLVRTLSEVVDDALEEPQ
ncbi:MAG: type II toxin-antitoxin system VapC family toxin [Armatimonadota bacterium]